MTLTPGARYPGDLSHEQVPPTVLPHEIAKLLRISEASARKTCERSLATLRTGVTAS